jgi:hypothetical protein
MTDFELSRRNLMAAAGLGVAGAALAGCDLLSRGDKRTAALSVREVSSLVTDFINERGINNHGHNPNEAPTGPTVPFNPKFLVVVHMTSKGPWAINSNLAHFGFADPDKAKRIDQASKICLNKLGKNHRRFRDEGRRQPFSPYDRKPAEAQPDFADSVEFAEFNFLGQHDIYIFYEHKKDEVVFDPDQLVTFSQYQFGGAPADENQAFFNAEVVDAALTGQLANKGSLIRLENHYTVWNGSKYELLGTEGQQLPAGVAKHYKMNLIYVAGSSGIPMLIDPDTGNGVGNGPP